MKILPLLLVCLLGLTSCGPRTFTTYTNPKIAAPSGTTIQLVKGTNHVSFLISGPNKAIIVSDIDNCEDVSVQVFGSTISTIDPPVLYIARKEIGTFLH